MWHFNTTLAEMAAYYVHTNLKQYLLKSLKKLCMVCALFVEERPGGHRHLVAGGFHCWYTIYREHMVHVTHYRSAYRIMFS